MNPIARSCLAAAAAMLVAGCAAPRIDGQWADPAFATRSLRDQKVLVSCRAPDSTLARLCEERMAAAVREAGGQALLAPVPVDAAGGHEAVVKAAREAGAVAAMASAVNVAGVTQSVFGPSLGFGLGGGFGGGRGGIGFGGIGMSVPLGGVRPQTSYGMGSTVLDAASGREMWSVRATSPVADDAPVQIGALARTSVDAMRDAGLFGPR